MIGLEADASEIHVEEHLDEWHPWAWYAQRDPRRQSPGGAHLQRPAVLRIGFAYALRGLDSAWRNHRVRCVAIVGAGRPIDGVTVRFHVARGGLRWVADDLEGYRSEGVAVLEAVAPQGPEAR